MQYNNILFYSHPMNELLKQEIAISLIPGIGPVLAKTLISYCGGVEAVFKCSAAKLVKIPGIGPSVAKSIVNHSVFENAEKELLFIEKNKIIPLFYYDKRYPERLKRCPDSPLILYYKGNAELNASRIISIVGTRTATDYGKFNTEKLVEDLVAMDVLVISGMAYGIDICAHKAALKNNLQTVGVFGHGLDRVYPSEHRVVAEKMLNQGGLLTEYISGTNPDRTNFPMRNRIVAGLADATIVIEASRKGGALITAELANSYHRDVFAYPGRVTDTYSQGCNNLIKTNRAALIESARDLQYIMGWENHPEKAAPIQKKLFLEYNPEEKVILDLFNESDSLTIDAICFKSNFTPGKVAGILLNLEFEGIVKSLPGKVYQLAMN